MQIHFEILVSVGELETQEARLISSIAVLRQHPGQRDSVAAGALKPDHHPLARGMLGDPGDRLGIAALAVADHQRGDGGATGRGQSRACVSRCVSPPTTASTTSANIGMRPQISFQP
jgi:hypothetical protein